MRQVVMVLVACGVVLAGGVSAQQRPQEIALQAAMRTETVSGDLKGAIAQYGQIVEKYGKTDRAVAATALVRMAECHHKLGEEQARRLFERVLREFGDQKEAVQIASARLGRGKAAVASAGMVNRQVWTGRDVDPMGTISPDGKSLSFTDWNTGDLAIRDLSAGTIRHLTAKGTWGDSEDFAESSTISGDGAQVAYSWYDSKTNRYQVRILSTRPGAAIPRTVLDNPEITWVAPYDWSPDSKRVAVQLQRRDRTAQIGLVDTASGAYAPLKSIDWRGATRMFFSPDGSFLAYDLPEPDDAAGRDVFILSTDGRREFGVARHPAYDIVVGWSPDGSSLLFASDRAGSMGLWAVPVVSGQPGATPTLLKADLGHFVASVGMSRSGALLYAVRTSASTIATAMVDPETGELQSAPELPIESYLFTVRGPDWSRDGKLLVAVAEQSRSRFLLTIRTPDGKRVRDLPVAMNYVQRPRWAPDGSITVQGADLLGRQGIYRVEAETGALSPIVVSEMGELAIQSSWLPDGVSLLFRRIVANKSRVILRNTTSGEERILLERPNLVGLSVSPDGQQFTYIVNDPASRTTALHLAAVDGSSSRELATVSPPAQLVNAVEWTPDGRALVFGQIDDVKQVEPGTSAWIVSAAGGRSRRLDARFPAGVRFHPDGRRVVYQTGQNALELWTLENFLPVSAAATSRR